MVLTMSQHSVQGQTKQALVNHIVASGAVDAFDANTVFMFSKAPALSKWELTILAWYENLFQNHIMLSVFLRLVFLKGQETTRHTGCLRLYLQNQ
jgi:hypothetical protein